MMQGRSERVKVTGWVVWVWQVSWELEDQESAASTMILTLMRILCMDAKEGRSMGTLSKRLVDGPGAFLCDFRWDQDGVETEKRGKTRKKTARWVRSGLRNF
jgi:hypothetical protein